MEPLPRVLIDDTAAIGEARVFVIHLPFPRIVGELIYEGENALLETQVLALNDTLALQIHHAEPATAAQLAETIPDILAAIQHHDDIRIAP
jgi:hypothetical protein